MGKELMLAVAGSGKTSTIIDRLSLERRALVITYTDNNYEHLLRCVIRKFGYVPSSITVLTYFGFLYGFCYRPLLELQLGTRGLNFKAPPEYTQTINRMNIRYYKDSRNYLFYNRLAKLIEVKGMIPRVIARIERFYDQIYIDEVQDIAGHDFNFLIALIPARVEILLVGDFHQHTFDTSRDGNTNSSLHDDIQRYEKKLVDAGVSIDKDTLGSSWRCGEAICEFVTQKLHINMNSHRKDKVGIVPVTSQEQANVIHSSPCIVKLFYQEHYKYGCHSMNWGASKGMDHFQDVCVILSDRNWKFFEKGSFTGLAAITRNKLYVACSRARGDLYIAHEKYFKRFKLNDRKGRKADKVM
jgi:DNA helicase II / ATP-dependent DNA helicase PcrA